MTTPLDPFSEVVDAQRRWIPDWYQWLKKLADPPIVKVTELPTHNTSLGRVTAVKGDRTFVTDATVTTFGTVVAGGGTNFVPVYSDGTAWRIG